MRGLNFYAVVTASLAVMEELAGSTGIQVRLTGGANRRIRHDRCRGAVEETFGNIFADGMLSGPPRCHFLKEP
jgi:hypothetical protein